MILPGESCGERSLVGYSPWGCKEADMTEWPTQYLERSKRPCLDREEVRETFYFCGFLFWGIYIAFQIKEIPLKIIPNLSFWAKGNKRNQHLFKLYWRRLLRVPWTARRSNQPVVKEINAEFIGRTDVEAEAPILWPPDAKEEPHWKRLMLGENEGRRRRG